MFSGLLVLSATRSLLRNTLTSCLPIMIESTTLDRVAVAGASSTSLTALQCFSLHFLTFSHPSAPSIFTRAWVELAADSRSAASILQPSLQQVSSGTTLSASLQHCHWRQASMTSPLTFLQAPWSSHLWAMITLTSQMQRWSPGFGWLRWPSAVQIAASRARFSNPNNKLRTTNRHLATNN